MAFIEFQAHAGSEVSRSASLEKLKSTYAFAECEDVGAGRLGSQMRGRGALWWADVGGPSR